MRRYRVMVIKETVYRATVEAESEEAAGAMLLAIANRVKAGDHDRTIEVDERWHEPIVWAQPDPPPAG